MIKATIQNSPYTTEMTFPCTEMQLAEWLGELRMNTEHLCPAATILQIEPAELAVLEDCEVSLDALNYLAKRMEGMVALCFAKRSRERNQFFAALTCDEAKIGWGLKNIINLTFNLAKFTLIKDVRNFEEVGKTHILNVRGCFSYSEIENKEWLVSEGKKLLDSGKGIQTEYGLLFLNDEIEFSEVFNGTTFPQYLCDPDAVLYIEIGYCGLAEEIELPCEEITIKKALCRLGADDIKDCKICFDSIENISDDEAEKIRAFIKNKDIFGLNGMIKSVGICPDQEQVVNLFENEIFEKMFISGYKVDRKGDFLDISLDGDIIASVSKNKLINHSADNFGEDILKIKSIVNSVSEYVSVYKKSPLLNAEHLSRNYRCLAEFNGTVFAATNSVLGFEFVTWSRTFDGKAVCSGRYFSDYEPAKEDFAVRSGLVKQEKLFNVEELENIRKCVNFTARHNGDLNFYDCEELQKLSGKISECIPEIQQSDAPEMTM